MRKNTIIGISLNTEKSYQPQGKSAPHLMKSMPIKRSINILFIENNITPRSNSGSAELSRHALNRTPTRMAFSHKSFAVLLLNVRHH